MSQDLTLAMRLYLDARKFVDGLTQSNKSLSKWSTGARTEIDKIRGTFNNVEGKLAAIGVSISATALTIQSARLDKNLNQIGATAGSSAGDITRLRDELFRLSSQTGKPVEDLANGFSSLVASGLSFQQALSSLGSINSAMAISGANAEVLANAVTVAARAFQFDLSNPRSAQQILEKMVIAGRLGNAELEDLAGVFGRVGNAARASGMSFDETLALIEGLSLSLPGQADKLATRAESTLRLFTNLEYLKAAQGATGVKFFDAKGARRETTLVFDDLKKKFDELGTDAERAKFIQKAFGKTDQDTRTGIFEILSGNNLAQMKSFRDPLQNAAEVFSREMESALNNSIDQVGRLKSTLTKAADQFAQKLNDGISSGIKKLLDPKQKGGWELSGMQLTALGLGAAGIAYGAKRFGGSLVGKFVGDQANLAGGVITGKKLENSFGVTPVFVTNMPAGGVAGSNDVGAAAGGLALGATVTKLLTSVRTSLALVAASPTLSAIASFGARGVALAGGAVTGAALTGYTIGTGINYAIGEDGRDAIGDAVLKAIAAAGSSSAQDIVNTLATEKAMKAQLKIEVEDKRVSVRQLTSDEKLEVDIDNLGRMFAFQ